MYVMPVRLKEWFCPEAPGLCAISGALCSWRIGGGFADYEPLTSSRFLNVLRPGMTVVDVGALLVSTACMLLSV